jgi:hypothetical protein
MFDKRCGILTGNVVLDVLFGLKISWKSGALDGFQKISNIFGYLFFAGIFPNLNSNFEFKINL